jgi:hypothetical protein
MGKSLARIFRNSIFLFVHAEILSRMGAASPWGGGTGCQSKDLPTAFRIEEQYVEVMKKI